MTGEAAGQGDVDERHCSTGDKSSEPLRVVAPKDNDGATYVRRLEHPQEMRSTVAAFGSANLRDCRQPGIDADAHLRPHAMFGLNGRGGGG